MARPLEGEEGEGVVRLVGMEEGEGVVRLVGVEEGEGVTRLVQTPSYHNIHQAIWCVPLSAGVGRTGTLITIDHALDQIQKERVVDIAGIIQRLRNQRMKMVQNLVSVCIGVVTTITLLV